MGLCRRMINQDACKDEILYEISKAVNKRHLHFLKISKNISKNIYNCISTFMYTYLSTFVYLISSRDMSAKSKGHVSGKWGGVKIYIFLKSIYLTLSPCKISAHTDNFEFWRAFWMTTSKMAWHLGGVDDIIQSGTAG